MKEKRIKATKKKHRYRNYPNAGERWLKGVPQDPWLAHDLPFFGNLFQLVTGVRKSAPAIEADSNLYTDPETGKVYPKVPPIYDEDDEEPGGFYDIVGRLNMEEELERSGLSPEVQRVMRESGRISPETRAAVSQAAQGIPVIEGEAESSKKSKKKKKNINLGM